jgi:hypothetical protein
MRNYISNLFLNYNLHGDDGMGGTIDLVTTSAGSDEDDLREAVADNTAFLIQSNDPGSVYTWTVTYPNPITQIYWVLDSRTLTIFANYLADFIYAGVVSIGNIPQLSVFREKTDPDYTPRHGWTSAEGVRHRESPSDKGDPEFDLVEKERDR